MQEKLEGVEPGDEMESYQQHGGGPGSPSLHGAARWPATVGAGAGVREGADVSARWWRLLVQLNTEIALRHIGHS